MPKPRKPKPEKYAYRLAVPATAEDVDRVRKLAAYWELNVSQVVRLLIAQACEREGLI